MRDPYVHAEKTSLPGFGHKAIQALSKRYKELEPSAVEVNLHLLRVASDILNIFESHLSDRKLSQGKFCVLMQLHERRC